MDLTAGGLLSLARDTVTDPRRVARQVMAVPLPLADRWLALLLTAVLSTLLAYVSLRITPPEARDPIILAMATPLRTLLIQVLLLFCGAYAVFAIGRARGGTGDLPSAVSLVAWLQVVMLLVQALQLAVQVLLSYDVALLLGLAGVVLLFRTLTQFVCELHGFRSTLVTLAGIVASMMALALLLALVVTPFLPALPANLTGS